MPPQQRLPLDELWPSPRQYFHPFVLSSSSSSSSAPSPSPQSFTPELPPQVITTNRGRSPKKKEPKNSNSNRSNTNKHDSNSNSSGSRKRNRNCLSRADSERDRRQALRDSIVKLKELLPVSSRSTTVQMDKRTVLKEACKHILDLKAEVQALVKKEELIICSVKAVQLRCNGSESVRVEEAKMSSIADCQKEDTVECSKRGTMFQEVVCTASNVFVTLQVPEGGGVRLSKVLGAIEKANVNIINAVASWTEGDPSFCLLAHGKAQTEASSSSIQALKEDLCALSFSS